MGRSSIVSPSGAGIIHCGDKSLGESSGVVIDGEYQLIPMQYQRKNRDKPLPR